MTPPYIYILLFTFILLGCSKSDEEKLKDDDYYTLTNINCACPIFEILENIQQCKIDKEKDILTIKTFIDNVERNIFLKEGEYPIIINEEEEMININGMNYYFFRSDDFLVIGPSLPKEKEGEPSYFYQKN